MFESANLKHKVDKARFRREEPKLREAPLDAQYDLKLDGGFPVLILIAGVEGAGKGETVNLLNEWMDPRHIATQAFFEPTGEELERPSAWRFWKALPPKGRIGIFFGAWHTMPLIDRVWGRISEGDFAQQEWDAYERAVCDMVDRTSTSVAPWTLVEANNKYHARIKVLKTLVQALEAALDRVGKKGRGRKGKG